MIRVLRILLFVCLLVTPSWGSDCGVQDDIRTICALLGIEQSDSIKVPEIRWCADKDVCKRLFCVLSNAYEVGEVLAIYIPDANTIIFADREYEPRIYYHELCHAVLKQTPGLKDNPITWHETVARQMEVIMMRGNN